ncbi:MAG TPA: FecR domain-containing protein [Syntrophorhabdaceae bacterium]|nr:FecR domain-containing protein [Syntrophorhabdaceae bacterium]HQM81884.1 FecR domain-containing protein [Syntrophorhabdaceae bacterium]
MKHIAALFCIICAIALPLQGYSVDPGEIHLRYLEGDVQVKTGDAKEWLPASINMPLRDSDQIWVPDNGKAELFLRNGAIVRLGRDTFLEMPAPGDTQPRFYLGAGSVYGNVIVEKGKPVIVETPAASFIAHGNSIFRIDIAENEDSTVSVFQGELYADRGTGQMRIGAGERMTLKKDAQYPVLAKLLPADEWEQWNKARDREFSRPEPGNATAYLPDELKPYSYDLNKNGRWIYEQEYGYVWTPTVIVVQDWSPYRVGRWVWMRGDYVWISYEPWGWVPYHYGRWAFIKARGWCWVPPRRGFAYWGPGYVGWVHTPTYVSWVPLAPGEIYYGRGHYGPHSVNIKNVTVQNVTVNRRPAYKNIHVKNAIAAVHRDTFVTGRQVKPAPRENLFLKEKMIMGAPEIRPEKAAHMPVIKDIPREKQPPAKIAGKGLGIPKTDHHAAQIQNRPINISAPENAVNRLKQVHERRVDLQRGTFRRGVTPPTTGQPASARYAMTELQKTGAEGKMPAAPAARQEAKTATVQQRVPAAIPQAQPSVPARLTDVPARRADIEKDTKRAQSPAVTMQRTRTLPATPQTFSSARPTSAAPPAQQPTRSRTVSSPAQQPTRSRTVSSPAQRPAQTPSAMPQRQPAVRAPSVEPPAQSPGRGGMQISAAAPRERPAKREAPRTERKGGR